jgi:uncharacterized protein YhdP
MEGQVEVTLAPPTQGHARIGHADIDLTLRDLALQRHDGPLNLSTLSLAARVGLDEAQWSVQLKQLAVQDPASLTLKIQSAGQGLSFDRNTLRPRAGQLQVSRFELADVSPWLDRLPLSDDWRDRLRQQAPRGTVTDGTAKWSRGGGDGLVWDLNAGFEHASLTALAGSQGRTGQPGFNNLAGRVQWRDQGGRLQLSSTEASIVLPGLLAEPAVALDQLAADVQWRFESGATVLNVEQLRFSNADLAGDLSGTVQIPDSKVAAQWPARWRPPPNSAREPQWWIGRAMTGSASGSALN